MGLIFNGMFWVIKVFEACFGEVRKQMRVDRQCRVAPIVGMPMTRRPDADGDAGSIPARVDRTRTPRGVIPECEQDARHATVVYINP